jgi:methylthioribose-1-phosphate isomerase
MNVNGTHYRTIWTDGESPRSVKIIDQRLLPHDFVVREVTSVEETATAIKDMWVRGAGLIGAMAGWGMYLAVLEAPSESNRALFDSVERAAERLMATRPTAKNLEWAVRRQIAVIRNAVDEGTVGVAPDGAAITAAAYKEAVSIADEDAEACASIGRHGLEIVREIYEKKRKAGTEDPVRILTHCNAGWLAFVDFGSATAPVYAAHDAGVPVSVWVDETRPRNQGARLTAWELGQHGVPYRLIVDNAGGHLMQHGLVDLVIVGSDRTTASGDVANKIGTYLKALAAQDNGVPFYVALPSSTFDWELNDGVREIPIEERDQEEVRFVGGRYGDAEARVLICPEDASAANFAFDVTPSRLVTGLITERGVCDASREGISSLFPEKFA